MDHEHCRQLGDAYREAGKYDDAVAAYTNAEHAIGVPVKKDWPLFYARAMAEDKAGNWDKAEADVNAGLKLSPDEPELGVARGSNIRARRSGVAALDRLAE